MKLALAGFIYVYFYKIQAIISIQIFLISNETFQFHKFTNMPAYTVRNSELNNTYKKISYALLISIDHVAEDIKGQQFKF